ncbi:MAG: DsbE family thiol:disulfide interchange protein [Alphaproteobacteria bacterium]|nr:DsbE family thiol:disulfide interchange protein [Alphaproteobacteria bacterium]
MKPQIFALVPLLLFIGLVALVAVPLLRGTDPAKPESPMIGRAAPAAALPPALAGVQGFAPAEISGKPAVINFFASWCVPCQAEQPFLARMAREYGIAIYGVNYKDKPEALAPWLQKHGNPFTAIGADADGRAAIDWGVYGVPETFVIDSAGIIRLRHVGPVTAVEYEKIFAPLLAEMKK